MTAADPFDLDLDALAVLQRAKTLVIGAAGNKIARVQRHDRGGKFDELEDAVLHVAVL